MKKTVPQLTAFVLLTLRHVTSLGSQLTAQAPPQLRHTANPELPHAPGLEQSPATLMFKGLLLCLCQL